MHGEEKAEPIEIDAYIDHITIDLEGLKISTESGSKITYTWDDLKKYYRA